MNSKELWIALEAAGWRVEADPMPSQNNDIKWYAYRRLNGASDCVCNDKPPSLVVRPSEFVFQGKTMRSAEIEITGEASVGWINFKIYSVSFEEVLPGAEKYESALRAAWEAVAFKPAQG